MIPIFLPTQTKTEIDRVEKRMIRFFGDSTLNSQHTITHRRFVLGARFAHKKKSASCIARGRTRYTTSGTKITNTYANIQPNHNQFFNLSIRNSSTTTTTKFYSLCELLKQDSVKSCHMANNTVRVDISGNLTTYTNWNTIRLLYGNSIVTKLDSSITTTLASCVRGIKNGSITSLVINKVNIWNDKDSEFILNKLGRGGVRYLVPSGIWYPNYY